MSSRLQNPPVTGESLLVAGWLVEPDFNLISRNGTEVHLDSKTMGVLLFLGAHRGEVVSRERLIEAVWPDTFVSDQVLANAVWQLRHALGDTSRQSHIIQTIPKKGYCLLCEVTQPELQTPVLKEQRESSTAVPTRRPLIGFSSLLFVLTIIAVVSVGGHVESRRYAGGAADVRTLAVLPFADLSPVQQSSLASGLQDELITHLSQAPDLQVISRTSSEQFSRPNQSVPEIGRQLGADALVEGTINRTGEQVRITVQLIDAHRDVHLWARIFQFPTTELIRKQYEISDAITHALGRQLTPASANASRSVAQMPVATYELYLRGNQLMHRLQFREASEYYQAVVRDAPEFAPAYVGLGFAYAELSGWMSANPPGAYKEEARKAAERAIELDPGLADGYVVLGWIRCVFDWDWAGARAAFDRAAELGVRSPFARVAYTSYLTLTERYDEAARFGMESVSTDPFNVDIMCELVVPLVQAGRVTEAKAIYRKILQIAKGRQPLIIGMLGYIPGDRELQLATANEVLATPRCGVLCLLVAAKMLGRAGEQERGRVVMRQVEERARKRYVPRGTIAMTYVALGDDDAAIHWLEQGLRDHDPSMCWLRSSYYAALRTDPRFEKILAAMNFPPEQRR